MFWRLKNAGLRNTFEHSKNATVWAELWLLECCTGRLSEMMILHRTLWHFRQKWRFRIGHSIFLQKRGHRIAHTNENPVNVHPKKSIGTIFCMNLRIIIKKSGELYAKLSILTKNARALCKTFIFENSPGQCSKSHNSGQTVWFFEGSKTLACATLLSTQKMRQSGQNYDFWNAAPVDFTNGDFAYDSVTFYQNCRFRIGL